MKKYPPRKTFAEEVQQMQPWIASSKGPDLQCTVKLLRVFRLTYSLNLLVGARSYSSQGTTLKSQNDMI